MQPLIWDRPSGGLARPGDGVRVQGLERRRRRRLRRRLASSLASFDARDFARDRPRGVLRLPASRPSVQLNDGNAREIVWPTVEMFAARGAARADATSCSSRASSRRCAGARFTRGTSSTAREALGVQLVVTLGALLADVPHTRPVAISGHASDRGADRAARLRSASTLRGADRDRRRAAQRLRAGRPAVGEPVGGGAALRRRRANPKAALALVRASRG